MQNVFLAHIGLGEGWHNYHHAFPWDYKAAELGDLHGNVTAAFIDFFARVGWAYDLKTASKEMVARRVRRTGDGSHPDARQSGRLPGDDHDHDHGGEVWGWGDEDMSPDDVRAATIINKAK